MTATLPLEVLQIASQACPCRDAQIRAIASFYNGDYECPPTTVVYGLEGTGKLEVISAVLEARKIRYSIVRSRECLSQRHLLGKIFTACIHSLDEEERLEEYDRIDSLNAVSVNLQRLFQKKQQKLIVVLDSIDEVKGAGPTMLPTLARLGDMIPELSMMFTTTSIRPLPLHRPGIPCVYFPAYTRSQAVHIQCSSAPSLPETFETALTSDEIALIYKQFAITVYDSLIAPTSTSLSAFRNVCERLWPSFIWPAISGENPPGKAKKWDFPRLIVRGRTLFHADGESALLATLQPNSQARSFDDLLKRQQQNLTSTTPKVSTPSKRSHPTTNKSTSSTATNTTPRKPLLTPLATLLLLSAHLSSHTPFKHDILLFSRLSTAASKHRKIRYIKRGNPGASGTTPKKAMEDGRRKDKTKSLAPKSFAMERLLAVARAVSPELVGGGVNGMDGEGWSDQVARAMGELERMRLVRREEGLAQEEGGGGGGKWKVNVGREVVVEMAARQGLGVQEWELDL